MLDFEIFKKVAEKTKHIKAKIDEIEAMIKQNVDDFKSGILDYEDLHNSQYVYLRNLKN